MFLFISYYTYRSSFRLRLYTEEDGMGIVVSCRVSSSTTARTATIIIIRRYYTSHLLVQRLLAVCVAHADTESGAHNHGPTAPLQEQHGEHRSEG